VPGLATAVSHGAGPAGLVVGGLDEASAAGLVDGLGAVVTQPPTSAPTTSAMARQRRGAVRGWVTGGVWSESAMGVDTPAWVRDAVFYQIFPDRFAASATVVKPGELESWDSPPTLYGFKGGDLIGIVEHLPYLVDLGVTAIYLTPIFSSGSNHRYHTYDYFHVDPMLGGDAGLRTLLDAAHERGLRVVLDGVFNHTGRGFWPFHHILETGPASPYRNWFHLDAGVLDGSTALRAYPGVDASPSDYGYRAWSNLPALPKLNTDEPQVREFLFSVAEHWLRFGIDGWRLDVPAEIDDEAFWQEFRVRCRAVRPDAYLVGEIWEIAPDWLRGDRFDALMNYPLAEAILSFAGGPSLDMAVVRSHHEYRKRMGPLDGPGFAARLAETLEAYDPDIVAVQLNLLGSHDAPRMRTVLGDDDAAVRLAILLQMTLPGAPSIYYGDEVGLTGGNDPDCRRAFPWDEGRWDASLHAYMRDAVRLRSSEMALRHGSVAILAAAGETIVYERRQEDRAWLVAVNAGAQTARIRVRPTLASASTPIDRLAVGEARWSTEPDGSVELVLGGRAGRVLELGSA
jgi:cyclomaltodextrinase / maltogenic alpha-amylase / neopullulanase